MDFDLEYKPDLVGLRLKEVLSGTRYACIDLNRIQGTRDNNYVYRGTLSSPLPARDGGLPERTVIIKYSDEGPQLPPERYVRVNQSSIYIDLANKGRHCRTSRYFSEEH